MANDAHVCCNVQFTDHVATPLSLLTSASRVRLPADHGAAGRDDEPSLLPPTVAVDAAGQ